MTVTELTKYKSAAKTDRAAVLRILGGLKELDWEPTAYDDGEERTAMAGWEKTAEAITDDLMATDESSLLVRKVIDGKTHNAVMFFVFGNSPWEVMADCSYFEEWNTDLALIEAAINLEGE